MSAPAPAMRAAPFRPMCPTLPEIRPVTSDMAVSGPVSQSHVRKPPPNCGNRSWSDDDEAFLLLNRSQKMPYKAIAAHLRKTELACRLHFHQLTHGSSRRKRASSGSSGSSDVSPISPRNAHDVARASISSQRGGGYPILPSIPGSPRLVRNVCSVLVPRPPQPVVPREELAPGAPSGPLMRPGTYSPPSSSHGIQHSRPGPGQYDSQWRRTDPSAFSYSGPDSRNVSPAQLPRWNTHPFPSGPVFERNSRALPPLHMPSPRWCTSPPASNSHPSSSHPSSSHPPSRPSLSDPSSCSSRPLPPPPGPHSLECSPRTTIYSPYSAPSSAVFSPGPVSGSYAHTPLSPPTSTSSLSSSTTATAFPPPHTLCSPEAWPARSARNRAGGRPDWGGSGGAGGGGAGGTSREDGSWRYSNSNGGALSPPPLPPLPPLDGAEESRSPERANPVAISSLLN